MLSIKRSEIQSLLTPKNQLIFWFDYKELLSWTDAISISWCFQMNHLEFKSSPCPANHLTKVLLYILFICLRLHKHISRVTRKFKLFGGNNRHKLHFGCHIHRDWYKSEYFNCIYGWSSTRSMGSQKLSSWNLKLLQHKYCARH